MLVNVFWFRRDLRLQDQKGLSEALKGGIPVHLVFIFDVNILNELDRSDHRVTFIWDQLHRLKRQLREIGRELEVFLGKPEEVWECLLQENPQIHSLFLNHDYEPYAIKRDKKIRDLAVKFGKGFLTFKDQVIFEKDEVLSQEKRPFQVYTPFKKAWLKRLSGSTDHYSSCGVFWDQSPPPKSLLKSRPPFLQLQMSSLSEIGFERSRLEPPKIFYSEQVLKKYKDTRDFPWISDGTTRMGLFLRFGTVSVRSCVRNALRVGADTWLSELIWREFFMQILYYHPEIVNEPYRKEFLEFPYHWREDHWQAWIEGKTGYPLVDAGMRELLATGYMHNRVRMVVGSFLTKNLLISWQKGERYFAKMLYDFELASNIGNWQWVAGCGVDAAPYFRIFNPELQALKFDPQGEYIKKWVPEWGTSSYPKPIVNFRESRTEALRTLENHKRSNL